MLDASHYQYTDTDILIWNLKPVDSPLYGMNTQCACIY